MDILYYSNYCKHSKEVLDFMVKHDLVKRLNCINVDRRKLNTQTGQMNVFLENGTSILLPPNVHSVPCMLLLKENYRSIMGKQIIEHFRGQVSERQDMATQGYGEPLGFTLGAKDIRSEAFTMYSATAEDLSAKGSGGNRPLYNYVSADGVISTIDTPPETYKPDKVGGDVTLDNLQHERSQEMQRSMEGVNQTPFLPQTI